MKKIFFTTVTLFLLNIFSSYSQSNSTSDVNEIESDDSTGLPGDHFNLAGALELFKKSDNLESFEKSLNTESYNVNNLDLNDDGEVDYVRVIDNADGQNHAIVLQISVNTNESQDVAVIELGKVGQDSAILQIIGDKELYGESTIVEPASEMEEVAFLSDGRGPNFNGLTTRFVLVNVWGWPCVQFIYRPVYSPWVSPYYWGNYPIWWKKWRPYSWRNHWYFGRKRHRYFSGYCYYPQFRLVQVHTFYGYRRNTSRVVINRYKPYHISYHKKNSGRVYSNQGRINNMSGGKSTNAKKLNGFEKNKTSKNNNRSNMRNKSKSMHRGRRN